MLRKAISNKIIVLGVDGMEPSLTKKFMDQGKLPNIKKIVECGVAREDLVMLGGVPTITPPLWTTLSTGAYPNTHGITCFNGQSKEHLDTTVYNLDSRLCKAEQLWDVFATAGKKTLVWHWPGSSWPPTSDNPNLHVVDGTQPVSINLGVAGIDWEKIVVASNEFESVLYKPYAASNTGAGCILTDLKVGEGVSRDIISGALGGQKEIRNIMFSHEDGELALEKIPFDIVNSPIKEPAGWENAPEGAKEFTIVASSGFSRRPALILKNEKGVYDTVAVYKSKKETKPYVVIKNDGKVSPAVAEEIKKEENTLLGTRIYKTLEIAPDGSKVRIWMSAALDANNDSVWHPKSLYRDVVENVGYVPPIAVAGGGDPKLTKEVLMKVWELYTQWQANALNYSISKEDYDVVFSHLHNIDCQGHAFWHYAKTREGRGNDEKLYQQYIEDVYVDTDKYMGEFIHLLDKGWTVIITSDHGLICPEDHPPLIGDPAGVNVRVMEELGYTTLKRDENGNELKEIDWEKTKAVATRGNHIWINLKGRNKTGIVDPEGKDALEKKIIDDLYNYREPHTGRRAIKLALRNKDAAILNMNGPECGDILYWLDDGFNRAHGDSLSTQYGYFDTTVSPLFIAAGQGLKKGVYVDRVIRQVDVAPTIAVLGGVRMPAQCEGAPICQIFEEDI